MATMNGNEIDDRPYTSREIGLLVKNLHDEISGVREVANQTLTQATNTNGKVAEVTVKQAKQAGYLSGISVVGSILVVGVFSVLGYFFLQFVSIKTQLLAQKEATQEIQTGVEQGMQSFLANYNQTVIKQ